MTTLGQQGTTLLMEASSPLDNVYEAKRRAKIAENQKRLEQYGIPVARQLFDSCAPPCIKRPRARRAVEQQIQRCSSRLLRIPKPNYVEALPIRDTRARLVLTIRGDTMSAKPPKAFEYGRRAGLVSALGCHPRFQQTGWPSPVDTPQVANGQSCRSC